MALDQESYYLSLMQTKGRSASICAPGHSSLDAPQQTPMQRQPSASMIYQRSESNGHGGSVRYSHTQEPHDDFDIHRRIGGNGAQQQQQYGGGGGTPQRFRKSSGAHRSQSARVVGSNRPKVKRREREVREYEQHLDLASSESALRDCQESYNPFLNKVPSSGRLITSTSLEMSSNSLHGTPPPGIHPSGVQQHQQQQHQQQQRPTGGYHNNNNGNSGSSSNREMMMMMMSGGGINHSNPPMHLPSSGTPPRGSPKMFRRHSGAGFSERRGSDKSTPEQDRFASQQQQQQQQHQQQQLFQGLNYPPNRIPVIATPEVSPQPLRRAASSKPMGLPKSPQALRSGGAARRVNSVKVPRKTSYLDVPDRDSNPATTPDDEDEESYRLRSFSITGKGIVNRGDSFRRRRSRSNSLIPTPTTPEPGRNGAFTSEDGLLLPSNAGDHCTSNRSPLPSPRTSPRPSIQMSSSAMAPVEKDEVSNYRVAMLGARGVGKTALVSQFMTSECINAYDHDRQNDVEGEETVSVMLNGEESEMTIVKINNPKTEINRSDPPDAFLLVYSVVDRSSFQRAETELRRLQEWNLLQTKAVVLVANKIDLARSRAVSTQDGRCLAVSFRVKFTEISVGINHNVDELLVGLLHQIRLKNAQSGNQDIWCKHRGILRASVKARQMLTWLLGKEDVKFKNCENLHIL